MSPVMSEWLTYQEAGARLGIKAQSVKKRAIRRHWPRMTGNDGLARVQIPDDTPAPVPGPKTGDIPGDLSPPNDTVDRLRADLAAAREALAWAEGENAMNRERIADLAADRDRWREMADRLSQPQVVVRPRGLLDRILGRNGRGD